MFPPFSLHEFFALKMTAERDKTDISAFYGKIMPETQSELRQAAEKNVLTYLTALGYDQKPRQLILERGLTFAPLPPDQIQEDDPAANTNCLGVDSDTSDISALNANFMAPMSGTLIFYPFLFQKS